MITANHSLSYKNVVAKIVSKNCEFVWSSLKNSQQFCSNFCFLLFCVCIAHVCVSVT